MTNQELLQIYTSFSNFLAEVLGPGCEIVVHDVTDPNHSIIAIHNSLSSRNVGDPMTDLACQIIDQGLYSQQDYMAGYSAQTVNGNFRSATYFIKNQGELIGMLCINRDMHFVQQTEEAFRTLMERFCLSFPQDSVISERLDTPIVNVMQNRITEIINQSGVSPNRMSMEEKIQTVHRLNDAGIMMMKGAAAEIGRQLDVSVATVYRYLSRGSKD